MVALGEDIRREPGQGCEDAQSSEQNFPIVHKCNWANPVLVVAGKCNDNIMTSVTMEQWNNGTMDSRLTDHLV